MSPSKTSLGQDLLWRLEALGYDAFAALARVTPIEWMSGLGGWLLRTLGPLTGSHRTAERNMLLAFPDMGEAERRRLLAAQWDNLGRVFAEFPQVDRIARDPTRIEVAGRERLVAIAKSDRPAVLISGHFANWEVMAWAILDAGIPCQVTYRAANNPYVDRRIRQSRERYGIKLFAPKGGDGARELLDGMKRGESIALMNDQKFNQGLPVPFFGHPAMTAPGATRMALRFGTILQPMSVRRLKGARFRVEAHEPIMVEDTGDRARDIEAGLERVSAFIEARVREHPQDWFWVHKRWPNAAYATLESASDSGSAIQSAARSSGPS